jgi:hypothetical protein
MPSGTPNVAEGDASGALAAALFATGIAPWLWPAHGGGWQVLLATVACAVIAVLPFVGLYRFHLVRRWRAALDAYAAREIDRERRRKARSAASGRVRADLRRDESRTRR